MKNTTYRGLIIIRCLIVLFWVFLISVGILFFSSFTRQPHTLNILAWGDLFDELSIRDFEKETGIRVTITTASSNEEMLIKLKANNCDYDLIIPSDYAVSLLLQERLLKPLDNARIINYHDIHQFLLHREFDAHNTYSVPVAWEIFGFGINKKMMTQDHYDWPIIFDNMHHLCMVNDPVEAINIGALYLYGVPAHLSHAQIYETAHLLKKQKKQVTAYSDFRADYFLVTENCPLVVSSSSYILRNMKNYPAIDFVVPDSGSFITIENYALPVCARHEDAAYLFINFMYRPEVAQRHCERFAFFPALSTVDVRALPDKYQALLSQASELLAKSYFFKPLVSDQEKNDTWIFVKS
ncbi:MAG: extracellular solute-binding protein [Candidatus Babeliaceae bacterium]